MDCFKVLPGLPSTGPMYIPFTATGHGKYSEGLAVEFQAPTGDPWVGNFAKGLTLFSAAVAHPDGKKVIVISGGQGYVVDPITRTLVEAFGGWWEAVVAVPERNLIIFQSPFNFLAINPAGRLWETRRLSLEAIS
jgi:hypothetical protein